MIHFVVPAALEWTVREYLAHWGLNLADRFRILHYESLPARRSFDRGTYVLTGFGGFTPGMCHFLEELLCRLSEAGGIRFLNHPTRTLRRYELLEELWRRNRNEFRAARAAGDFSSLRYPVFLRSDRMHDGALSPLLRSPREVEAAIGRAVLLGRPLDDLLVVEFCDTADAKGYYRKYTAYIVGDRILARNVERSRDWMIKHARSEFTTETILEEREYCLTNPHERELREIFEIAGAQYGRVDYAVKGGRIQTWEINYHPTIGRGPDHRPSRKVPPELEPLRQVAKEHFYRGFAAAWESVDLSSAGQLPVSVALDPQTIRAGLSGKVRRGRLLGAVRSVLRPVRPLLEPLATHVFPLLGRLTRHGRLP